MKANDEKWLGAVRESVEKIVDEVPSDSWEAIAAGVEKASARKRRFKAATISAFLCAAAAVAMVLVLPYNKTAVPSGPSQQPLAQASEPAGIASDSNELSAIELSSDAKAHPATGPQRKCCAIAAAEVPAAAFVKTDTAGAQIVPSQKPEHSSANNVEMATGTTQNTDKEQENRMTIETYLAANQEKPSHRPRLHLAVGGNDGLLKRDKSAASTTVYQWCTVQPDGTYIFSSYTASKTYNQLLEEYLAKNKGTTDVKDGLDYVDGNDGAILEVIANDTDFQKWLIEKGYTGQDVQFLQAFSYRHLPPVKAKLVLSADLSDRWSVETGASYTLLASEITAKVGSSSSSWQRLQFVGIPLAVRYEALQSGRNSLYFSLGGEADKCVKATGVLYGKPLKRLFWSTSANVGYQFDILPYLGVFLESGAAYHFDNGTEVRTVYTEHPLQASFQIGFRLTRP